MSILNRPVSIRIVQYTFLLYRDGFYTSIFVVSTFVLSRDLSRFTLSKRGLAVTGMDKYNT